MAFSFPRKRGSSPKASDFMNGNLMPANIWKRLPMDSKGRPDTRKISQYASIGLGVLFVLYIFSRLFRSGGSYNDPFRVDRGPTTNMFMNFEGDLECKLNSHDIYLPAILDDQKHKKDWPYCSVREKQSQAMSNGGRYGFDTPYVPLGCHYKWYTTLEICMILERFDGVAFVGDDLVQSIYGAFNMLLRSNLAFGALEQWRMDSKTLDGCRCRKQFTNPECSKYFVKSSEEVQKHDGEAGQKSPYTCGHMTPNWYFQISGPGHPDVTSKFRDILDSDPHSWKPVAIIHSLGLSTGFNWQIATESMDEWLTIADASGRNTPFYWLGPNAAGHLKPPSKIMQEGNNALWHYSLMMANEAKRRGVESLNSYNLTLQASSWDGSNYDERIALVQAMEIVNWLAKVETT